MTDHNPLAMTYGVVTGAVAFLGDRTGSAYAGIADAAMPDVRAVDETGADERVEVYRGMVEAASRDGKMELTERLMLTELRARLGISPEQGKLVQRHVAESLQA